MESQAKQLQAVEDIKNELEKVKELILKGDSYFTAWKWNSIFNLAGNAQALASEDCKRERLVEN